MNRFLGTHTITAVICKMDCSPKAIVRLEHSFLQLEFDLLALDFLKFLSVGFTSEYVPFPLFSTSLPPCTYGLTT